MVSPSKYRIYPPLLYPATMIATLGLFFALQTQALPLWFCTYIPVVLGAGLITFFERYTPHLQQWLATKKDVWNDTLFMVTLQMVLPKILSFIVVLSTAQLIADIPFIRKKYGLTIGL